MPSHVLFLLHGIGQRAPAGAPDQPGAAAERWPKAPVELFVRLARKYAPGVEVSPKPDTDGIRIVPLSYCDLIVRQIADWAEFGSSDVSGAVRQRFASIAPILGALQGISEADAPFFWNGPVDLLFYRFFFDQDIRTHVRRQIADALTPSGTGDTMPSCSFICHSMGTSVLHDTLHEMLTDPDTFGGFANMDVHCYASIANVSTVMRSLVDPHASAVRPIGALPGNNVPASVRRFIDVRHSLDPVVLLGLFKPFWPTNKRFYRQITIQQLKWTDVHGLVKYLEHPRVHIPILRVVCGAEIDRPTEERAIADYEAEAGDPCPGALQGLRERVGLLHQAWEMRGAHSPVDFAVALVDAWKAFDRARRECGQGGIV